MGLSHDTDRAQLGQAVLEGVAFALADGQRALTDAGANLGEVSVIGGGAQSRDARDICPPAPIEAVVEPNPEAVGRATERLSVFRDLYQDLKPRFPTLHRA